MKRLILLLFISNALANKLNTCNTIISYALKGLPNTDCTYNEDVETNMPQLVTNHKYPVEEYKVTTKDGYILTMFRLPQRNPKGVVYLVHAATASCTVWVDKGPKESLGLALYNAGYDVWLGNSRGTFYSRNHTKLNPNLNEFWEFSYHEIAIYDLPATIEFISSKTKSKNITYIGHSMSGTSAAIYTSLMPDHAAKYINVFILQAPIVFPKNLRTPVKYFRYFADLIYAIGKYTGNLEVGRLNRNRWFNKFCGSYFLGIKQCIWWLQVFFGPDRGTLYYKQMPIMWGQNPAGLSLKCAYHYAQSMNANGQFQMFDYGKTINLERYNSTKPPLYPIQNIKSSFYLMSGENDYIGDTRDIIHFQEALPKNTIKMPVRVVKGYNHGHFAYGKNLEEDIIMPIVKFINDWKNGNIANYL